MFHDITVEARRHLVAAARGARPLDVLIRDIRMVNVFTCEIRRADIGVFGNRIALVADPGAFEIDARAVVDGAGRIAAPGLIDPHLHIESSMVDPAHYAAAVLRHGTTTVIVDPHEIANVMGKDGVRLMIEGSEGLPLRVLFAIPSCVPAVLGHETAGARFAPEDVAEMLAWPRVIAVAEVMDYVGVGRGDPRMLGIIDAGIRAGKVIQGHAPALVGRDLVAYKAAGIENDHELRNARDAVEKLRLGLTPFVKLGSHANHLPNVMPELAKIPRFDVALCTDDVEPSDLLHVGHLNRVVREVAKYGIDPARALRWASLIPAQHYNLRDLGAIAPGYVADIVLFDGEDSLEATDVMAGGRWVVRDGAPCEPVTDPLAGRALVNTVRINTLSEDDFAIPSPIGDGPVTANIIALQPNRTTRMEATTVPARNGRIDSDTLPADVVFIAVVPRHGQAHPPSVALLSGIGLQRGAFAHTVAHDSHNILVTGKNSADMLAAVRRLAEIGGGFTLVDGGRIVAEVALPLAGLMSLKPVADVSAEVEIFNAAAASLGIRTLATPPIVAGTGLALPVVPQIRITDLHPLFDVGTQEPVPMFATAMADGTAS